MKITFKEFLNYQLKLMKIHYMIMMENILEHLVLMN
jgi:hypothetical protein